MIVDVDGEAEVDVSGCWGLAQATSDSTNNRTVGKETNSLALLIRQPLAAEIRLLSPQPDLGRP